MGFGMKYCIRFMSAGILVENEIAKINWGMKSEVEKAKRLIKFWRWIWGTMKCLQDDLSHHIQNAKELTCSSIREQAFYPGDDIEFKEKEILFHQGSDQEFFVRVMSPKLFPKRTVFGVANLLTGDQMGGANQITEPFFFQFTAHYPDQVKKKGEVRQRHMWILS